MTLLSVSIRYKLIGLILLLLCVPFLIFGFMWNQQSTKTIETNAVQYGAQLLRQINDQLDAYFMDLERSTFPLVTHPLIQQFMKITGEDQYERFSITQRIQEEIIPNIIFGRPEILGFTIVSKHGISVSNYRSDGAKQRYEAYRDQLSDDKHYKIIGINEIDSTPVLTIARKFLDTVSYETVGMIIIDLRLHVIASICEKIQLGKTGHVWIMDGERRTVYRPEHIEWGKPIADEISGQFPQKESGFFIRSAGSTEILTNYYYSEGTGWTIVSEVPMKELAAELIQLRDFTIWAGLCLIILGVAGIGGFALSLTRSLLVLQKLMKRAEMGDLSVQAPEHRRDELGYLYRSFNRMVREIRSLIEVVHKAELREKEMEIKQRESTFLAMQSQINPHFLYNTLEVINSHAIVEGVMSISEMATSLADMFRYSAGNPKQTVTLRDEMEHIATYLHIQKQRFSSLSVVIRVDENIAAEVATVRLTIQPIVENAFKHGYDKHRKKPEYIEISGKSYPDYYVVHVADKGKGMDETTKQYFNNAFSSEELPALPKEATDQGKPLRIGLWNVHYRIRETFGKPYGLFIAKSDESGTIVEIKLPYKSHHKGKGEDVVQGDP